MQDIQKKFEGLLARIDDAMGKLDVSRDERRIAELEEQVATPGFWDEPQSAAKISQELAALKAHVSSWRDELRDPVADEIELIKQGIYEDAAEAEGAYGKWESGYTSKEAELKLSGPYDKNGAIITISAGAGGTDAQDWAEMLLRMYLRYCERAGFRADLLDQSAGEEAGIKSATIEVNGQFAFGRLRGERGVHRLVRLSPYNADNLRQTSFAMVDIMPQLENDSDVEVDPKDVRIDVFRAGGHGDQSVNTTDSAVRLTHQPTGLVVSIQNERSQLQNKEKAFAVLRARLAALMLEQHKEKVSELKGVRTEAAWGNQIRSYVLHPYTKVKDHRTGQETSAAQTVLDGDLDPFIDAFLSSRIGAPTE